MPQPERKAIKELRENLEINIKKADRGTTTVFMNKEENEGGLDTTEPVEENYKPLEAHLVGETYNGAKQLISELHRRHHIDQITFKWLSQTPNPPRIPVFYTLTKIHKANLAGRPIISGCDGPTERISAFVDSLLQLIMKE